MKKLHIISLLKAISWRFFGSIFTVIVAYFITRDLNIAALVGTIDVIGKIFFYYTHELLWNWLAKKFC